MAEPQAETPRLKSDPSAVIPLILEEWPKLSRETLSALSDDFESLVSHVAESTEHTRTLVRQQLLELDALAREGASRVAATDFEALLSQLEARTRTLVEQVQTDVLPKVEQKAQENVGRSLLTALGLGFILGLLFGGFGRGR